MVGAPVNRHFGGLDPLQIARQVARLSFQRVSKLIQLIPRYPTTCMIHGVYIFSDINYAQYGEEKR